MKNQRQPRFGPRWLAPAAPTVGAVAAVVMVLAGFATVVSSSSGTQAARPQTAPTRPPAPVTATAMPLPTATPGVYRSFMPITVREDSAWEQAQTGQETTLFGQTVEGRNLIAFRVGHGQELVVLVGGLHQGAERATTPIVEGLLAALIADPSLVPEGLSVIVIPEANPDGSVLGTRTNARAVDLNRNWPTEDWADPAIHGTTTVSAGDAPLSEPETAALHRFLKGLHPALVIGWHGYASIVEGNDLEVAEWLGGAFAAATGYELLEKWPYYPVTGEMIVALAEMGIPAFDVELDRWTTIEEDIEKNVAGLAEVLKLIAAGPPPQEPQLPAPSATPIPSVGP